MNETSSPPLPFRNHQSLSDVSKVDDSYKPFVYDASNKSLCRFFQLNYDDNFESSDAPLAGRLMTTEYMELKDHIKLFPNSWNDLMQGITDESEAVMQHLSGQGVYDALSYSWGREPERFPLYVSTISDTLEKTGSKKEDRQAVMDHEPERNGYLWITPNLYSFLLEMRRQKYKNFIWIDAICINQADLSDKYNQIPRMKNLYFHAKSVLVWLGSGSPAEHGMLQIMPAITTKLQNSNGANNRSLDDWFDAEGLPEPQHNVWKAGRSIMMRDWWSRLWTLQEVVMPKENDQKYDEVLNIWMLCGPIKVPWDQLEHFAQAIASKGLKSWLLMGSQGLLPDHFHGFDAIVEVRTCRQSQDQTGWAVAPASLLVSTRRRKATMPSDMVIGMQALLDYATVKDLALNESLSTQEIFIRFAKYYIRNESRECLLNHVSTLERLPGLPSWCPNFASSRDTTTSLGTRWLGHFAEVTDLKNQMPCAGFTRRGRWRIPRKKLYYIKVVTNFLAGNSILRHQYDTNNPRQITLVPNSDHIRAKGVDLDTIIAVIPPNTGAEAANFLGSTALSQTLDWDRRCFTLAKRTLKNITSSHQAYDIYARTLVANRVLMLPSEPLHEDKRSQESEDEDEDESDKKSSTASTTTATSSKANDDKPPAEIFIDRYEQKDFATGYLQFRNKMQEAVEAETGIDEQDLDYDARRFARCFGPMTKKRTFFATKSGRIGLGPANAQPGDKIVVIFYCPTPYLLRKSNLNEGVWKFVGECYIRGLMYSEALQMYDFREIEETKWEIE